ncbi:MAG: cell division protein FtsA [Chloroflexi bacterium]|nr:cell division protein FtsA [Chloroflexota bacterium]|tara:strand:- start:77293 stop:78549 length:1257 start_codon:yes stop_codon:yes gene_type:complete
MTTKKNIIISLDVGTSKVCCVVGENNKKVVEIKNVSTKKINFNSNIEEHDFEIKKAISESYREATLGVDLNHCHLVVSLSGSHIISKNIILNVPKSNNERSLITQIDIDKSIEIAQKISLDDDQKIIHVIPRTYTLDGIEGIRNPLGMHTYDLKAYSHVILGSITEITKLNKYLDVIGMKPNKYIVGSLASGRSLLSSNERESGGILIDIGGGTTDIAVFHKGTIIHTDSIHIGGNTFTNDISVAFDIDFNEAEKVKISDGSVTPERINNTKKIKIFPRAYDEELEITGRELAQLLKDRASELIRMIGYRLDNENVSNLDINQIILTGGGSKLDGFFQLTRFLLQKRVRNIDESFENNLEGEELDQSTSCAVSVAKLSVDENLTNLEFNNKKIDIFNNNLYVKNFISLKNLFLKLLKK